MKIITSKITIPTETPLVCRQGLLDTLRENLKSCHAAVINGRAGTGKTMLLANYLHILMTQKVARKKAIYCIKWNFFAAQALPCGRCGPAHQVNVLPHPKICGAGQRGDSAFHLLSTIPTSRGRFHRNNKSLNSSAVGID